MVMPAGQTIKGNNTETSHETKPKTFICPGETPIAAALYQMLQRASPSARPQIEQAYRFFNELHLPKRTRQDFERARAGLSCGIAQIAHEAQEYERVCNALGRQLDRDEVAALKRLEMWFEEDVRKAWDDILGILERSLPRDTLQEVKVLMNSIFDAPPG